MIIGVLDQSITAQKSEAKYCKDLQGFMVSRSGKEVIRTWHRSQKKLSLLLRCEAKNNTSSIHTFKCFPSLLTAQQSAIKFKTHSEDEEF